MKEQNLMSLEEFITALQALPYPAALILEKNKEAWIIQQFRLILFKPLEPNDLKACTLSPVG